MQKWGRGQGLFIGKKERMGTDKTFVSENWGDTQSGLESKVYTLFSCLKMPKNIFSNADFFPSIY